MASWPWWAPWAVYAPLGGLGAAWAYAVRGRVLTLADEARWLASPPWAVPAFCLGAVLFALGVVASTRFLVVRTRWARRLHLNLRGVLMGLSPSRLAQLALLSAMAEELLFRAAVAPSVGLVLSSLLFGALHVSPRGSGYVWGLWATLMGLCFGALWFASGSLWPPILAHALINYENMNYICNYDPTPLDIDRLASQASREHST